MLTDEEAARLQGVQLVTRDGAEVGPVENVLTHAADNRAAWAVVNTGDRVAPVPLDGAALEGDTLTVRYGAGEITSAPEHTGDQLDADAAERLYEHYGIDDSTLRDDSGFATEQGVRQGGTARDPQGGGGADDAAQGHP